MLQKTNTLFKYEELRYDQIDSLEVKLFASSVPRLQNSLDLALDLALDLSVDFVQ